MNPSASLLQALTCVVWYLGSTRVWGGGWRVWHPQEESHPTLLTHSISGRFDTVHSRVVGHPAIVCFPGGNKTGDRAETVERLAGRERGRLCPRPRMRGELTPWRRVHKGSCLLREHQRPEKTVLTRVANRLCAAPTGAQPAPQKQVIY